MRARSPASRAPLYSLPLACAEQSSTLHAPHKFTRDNNKMFSSRFLAVFALGLAAAAALPADPAVKPNLPRPITTITEADFDDSFFGFPMFSNFFAPIWRLFPSFTDYAPNVTSNDKEFKVSINVKDYSKDDLKVKVKRDFIIVEGIHQTKPEDHSLFATQFLHTYSLPENASSADVTAELYTDKYLVITSPINDEGAKGVQKAEDESRDVPIKETGTPLKEQEDIDNQRTGEREPTTPPTDRDVTNVSEKDNDIPHGTEILP